MGSDKTRPLEDVEDADVTTPVKGRVVGRYVLLGRLGSGGSGDVFSAFDPTLDRRVAVKLLHAHGGGADALIREGRLLAKLVHPSVVAVHDLGVEDGQPYLAMELVDGPDITEFADAQRGEPDGGALLDALRDVGEGLAAAHRSALVHGDIKPSNILRDNDGRTKLSDFGIAQLTDAGEMQAGAGTPAFMAPEQHAGGASSELADQYSFCLTAFVLMHGEHPFLESSESSVTYGASNDTPKARTAGTEDRLQVAAQQSWTPRWRAEIPSAAARAFERGLAPDPADRWPSMDALLAALQVRSRRRVGPWILAVGGVAAAATGAAMLATDSAADPCARAGEAIETSWNAEGAERMRGAWGAEPGVFSSSLDHVIASLDGFSDTWRQTSAEVCEATHVFGLQSPEMLDVRSDCLRRAQVSLEEVIDLVASDDPEIWAEAAQVVEGLPDPQRCAQTEGSALSKARSAQEQQRYEDTERLLERARFAIDAVALERAATALASAEPQVDGEPALEVLFLRQQARLLDWQGKTDPMRAVGKRALHLALQQDDITSAVAVASLQAEALNQQAGRLEEASDYAAMALTLSGHPDATDEDRFTANVGMGSVLARSGEVDEALTHFRKGLALGISAFGESDPNVAGVRVHMAAALQDAGRLEEALLEQQAALESREAFFGPDHPTVAQSHHNLSRLYYDMGRPESEHHTRRALEILIAAFGSKQMPVAMVQGGLGDEMRRQGRHDEALELYDEAIETLSELIGAEAPDTLVIRASRAVALGNLGRDDDALQALDAVLTSTRDALGDSHVYVARAHLFRAAVRLHVEDLEGAGADYAAAAGVYLAADKPLHAGRARALVGVADVARRGGNTAVAESTYAEAEALLDASGEPAGMMRARVEQGIGELALELGRYDEARKRLRRTLELLEDAAADPAERSEVTLALAQTERGAGHEKQAEHHAAAARALLDAAPTDVPTLRTALADFEKSRPAVPG